MKKLLIALSVALVGFAVQAASANWYVENIYEYGSSTTLANDYVVYFFDANDCSVAKATSDIAAGDFSFVSKGYAAEYQADGEAAVTAGSYGNSVDITSYYVVFNASTIAAATQAYISATDVGTTGAAGQAASFAFDASATASASNWASTAAVPEPTSGLLLLLGMAGLALKRKRA